MNKENMLAVANEIEQHPEHFEMSLPWPPNYETDDCGCIGGFAESIFKRHYDLYLDLVAVVFGLTKEQADTLIYPDDYPDIWLKYHKELGLKPNFDIRDIKAHHAITMLRNLANGIWTF